MFGQIVPEFDEVVDAGSAFLLLADVTSGAKAVTSPPAKLR